MTSEDREGKLPEEALTDSALLAAFEDCSLPEEQWTHRSHVRVAWLYASRHELTEAIDRMRSSIKAFNKAKGTPESIDRGYHESITVAFMTIVSAANCRTGPHNSSRDFCDACPDLLTKYVLRKYYSRDRLMSVEAKAEFVEPDLLPLSQYGAPARDSSAAVVITPMGNGHVPEVIELWKKTEGLILTDTDNVDDLARYFEDNPNISHVAISADRIVGAVLCGHDGRRGYLHHLAVASDRRGEGIGRRLVDSCLSELRNTGIRQCNLFVVDDHVAGREFWSRDGWYEWPNIRLMSRKLESTE